MILVREAAEVNEGHFALIAGFDKVRQRREAIAGMSMPWSESIRAGSAGSTAPCAGGVTIITDARQMHCAESQPKSTM